MRQPYLQSAFIVIAVTLCLLVASPSSWAQATTSQSEAIALHRQGHVEIPSSSVRRSEDAGQRAHTNVLIWRDASPKVPNSQVQNSQPSSTWETPASIACVYNLVPQVSGCPIATTTTLPTGGTGVIAIVDAYDDPNAASDLATFSSYFNLPAANFQVVYASGTQPAQDTYDPATGGYGGWELEESLDIEWAHAMAPLAKIILVEAASDSYADLMQAEQKAGQLVSQAGGGVVSNSWDSLEFNGSTGGVSETSYDQYFVATNVVFTVSTGDTAFSVDYPAVSPNVLAVGGTSLSRDSSGNFTGESYWDNAYGGGGGGLSQYESIPSYQSSIQSLVGTHRGVPDLSSEADPETGVAIYDSFLYSPNSSTTPVQEGWLQIGGTSVSSPTIAGRISANGILSSTGTLQNYIYSEYAGGTAYSTNFRDITSGASSCATSWDICSGIGSPLGEIERGIINTVAGNGTAGSTGDGGAATSAELKGPFGVAVDSSGNIYIADYFNSRIRKVTASTGTISTVAGNGTFGYSGDGGAATSAEMDGPWGVAVDSSGNIYIADINNNRIRKVTASTGIISTVAGTATPYGAGGYSGDGGAATSAELDGPDGVAVDSSGNIYIADRYNSRIRKVTASTGIISTVAGNGTFGYSGDGGAATSAELAQPTAVAVDNFGNIYLTDGYYALTRKVTASTGIISTIAGNGTAGYSGDRGAATSAELDRPAGVAVDSFDNIYIADQGNYRIRKVSY